VSLITPSLVAGRQAQSLRDRRSYGEQGRAARRNRARADGPGL